MSSSSSSKTSKSNPAQNLLPLLSSSPVSVPISNNLITSNTAINLTATLGENNNTIYVWRNETDPNTTQDSSPSDDRLVSKLTAGTTLSQQQKTVQALRWKEDGQFLAAGWSDGVVRLTGVEKSGRSVHSLKVGDENIRLVAWGWNRIKRGGNVGGEGEVEGLGKVGGGELAHQLEFLEVEEVFPKLSPLPVSGGSGDDMFLFSTTASLDFVFKGLKAEDADDVHVMVVGMEGGGIHLSIYDSFVIGTFRLKDMVMADPATNLELCGHSSRPEIPTHMLLFKPQDGRALGLVPMDLTFVHHSPVNLSLLASKVTMLQNLLRYVKQTQAHMATEWKGTRELPSRFLLGVQDDLAKWSENERGTRELTIIQALYHTVMTGHVFPPVKEWLLDVVAERGHKRWEKAVLNGLLNLRSLVHENFIPALERCGVILSRLLGLARFHESNKNIGFTAAEISKLMDIVACLMVVAHKVVLNVMTELEYFTAFSIWLRMEIDKQSSSSQSDELTEKEATMDNAKVLSYIQRYLVTSPLATYFDEGADENYAKGEELAEEGPSLLQLLDKEMQKQEAGQEYMKTLPHVDFLIKYLNKKAGNVFLNIAAAQKRGVRFGRVTTISLQDNKIWKQDVLLCAPNDALGETNIAVVAEKDKSIIFLFRTSFKITNGISGIPSTRAVMIKLPRGTTIIDFGFLSGKSLLALCHINDEPKYILLRIAYHRIQYEAYADGAGMRIVDFTDEEPLEAPFFGRYGLSNMSGFTPVRMEVLRGNALRGETPPRVCLVGRDRSVYKTYKLPKGWDSDGSSENREEEEEEEEEE